MISNQTIRVLDTSVREQIEQVLQSEVSEEVPYRILVWGSVSDGTDTHSSDLDVIIEYERADLPTSLEARIEDILEEIVQLSEFTSFDPVLLADSEVEGVITESSVNRVYWVGGERWVYDE